jgi:hypothetical protein
VSGSEFWPGIPADRVVAVVASLRTGMVQVGSGYLLSPTAVITTRHCTLDKKTGLTATALRVVRFSDGAQAPASISSASLDVAVLSVAEAASWAETAGLRPPPFGRVDVTHSGELYDCQAVGFPLWQFDSQWQHRAAAQIHGVIRTMEGSEAGMLVLRDPLLWDVAAPEGVTQEDLSQGSPWGGLSGALVFHKGLALGVIVQHHPRQGHSALTILPAQRITTLADQGDPDATRVAKALGIPVPSQLPLAQPVPAADLILPRVAVGVRVYRRSRQATPSDRLSLIVVTALRAAGINPDRCELQDEGTGGQIITLPAGVTAASTLSWMLLAAQLAAQQANAGSNTAGRVRILMSLSKGPTQLDAGRYAGPGVTAVRGMLDSPELGDALLGHDQVDLAVMISNEVYAQVNAGGAGRWKTARVRAIELVLPGVPGKFRCWLCIPQDPSATPWGAAFTGFSETPSSGTHWGGAGLTLLGAIPLAGMGAVAWWEIERSHHSPGSPPTSHGSTADLISQLAPQTQIGPREPLALDSGAHDPWSAHLPFQDSQYHQQGMDHLAGADPHSGLGTWQGSGEQGPGIVGHDTPPHLDHFSSPAEHSDTGESGDW